MTDREKLMIKKYLEYNRYWSRKEKYKILCNIIYDYCRRYHRIFYSYDKPIFCDCNID